MTALRNQLLFFDLEWLDVPEEHAQRLIADPLLAPYRHYLGSERRFKPHTLSEAEERLMNDKDLTGINAWQRLFTEFAAAARYKVEMGGQARELNQSQVLVHAARSRPEACGSAPSSRCTPRCRGRGQVLSFIYDTRFQDHLVTNRLRHYDDPMAPRHLANEIDGRGGEHDDGRGRAQLPAGAPLFHAQGAACSSCRSWSCTTSMRRCSTSKRSSPTGEARDIILGGAEPVLAAVCRHRAALLRRALDRRRPAQRQARRRVLLRRVAVAASVSS